MYVTRPISHYKRSPGSLSRPPDGPNSGYLVIQDEETVTTSCFGWCESRNLVDLPFPQDKDLIILAGEDQTEVNFIPVLNQPLSSKRYYAIKRRGSHKGEAYACSRKQDKRITDVEPRPLNPNDKYQQFEIYLYKEGENCGGRFCAKSVAPAGFPPFFLRSSDWFIRPSTGKTYKLGEALGINAALRAHLPGYNSPVVVGKWYCPFMFVKDGNLKDQMEQSLFYEMTLERRWEKIFTCENNFNGQGNSVSVEAEVQREVGFVGGREAVWDENRVCNGMVLFRSSGSTVAKVKIGVSSLILDRMKWEEERGGWVREENKQVNVNKIEEFGGMSGVWSRFVCYVLVERFVLKRMDRSVVLTYDFKHTHVIRSNWE